MKPTFALDFRDGQVTLLHRTSRGWSLVGSASFDAPDFDAALAYLRSTAMGLEPRGITTKLILPNDQILYTDVDVGAVDGARRRRMIRLALEGRTPYAVDDLVWDWSGEGPSVKVAVIARETLTEAEGFAVAHRFNPVSHVAVPDPGQFEGEVFFGPTAFAPQVLGEADKVERDSDAVQIVLRDPVKPEPGPAITEADLAPPVLDARDIEAEEEARALASAAPEAKAEAGAAAPDLFSALAPVEAEAPEPAPEPAAELAPGTLSKADEAPKAAPAKAAAARTEADVKADIEAPMALDVMADPAVEDELPPAPAAAITAAFATRKSAEAERGKGEGPTVTLAMEKAAAEKGEARSIGGVSRPGSLVRPSLAKAAPGKPEAGKAEPLPFPGKGAKTKVKSGGVTATTIPGMPRRDKNVVALPVKETAGTEAGAETGAGGKASKPARPTQVIKGRTPIGGKPRYLGFFLTVGLLILLAAIAVWSSFFMGTNEGTAPSSGSPQEGNAAALETPAEEPAAETAAETLASADVSADPVAAALPGASAPEATPEVTPDVTAEATAEGAPEAAAQADTEVAAAPALPAAEPDSAALAAPQGPVQGPVQSPVQGPVQAGETQGIRLATADSPPGVAAPQSLAPLTAGSDAEPAAPPAPPPFGTVYRFDENGLIVPTPEGILTPEGVLLVAGKPGQVPPRRPAELTLAPAPTPEALPTETAAPPPQTPGAILAPTGADPVPADPALAGKRPQARPEGIATPPEPTAADQEGALTEVAPTDSRLAALRPAARPEGLAPPPQVTAEAPQNNASLMASGAPLLTAPVTRSPRPPERPTDLSRSVDDAVTAALSQPAAQPEPQEAAAAQEEPEPDDRAPSLPTNASVAKQATVKDALNTRKLALLAVFGTSSNRFAMIRQANGAVKKVKVGDQLDGGRIAAITANSLQYQKGGRMVTLALPTG